MQGLAPLGMAQIEACVMEVDKAFWVDREIGYHLQERLGGGEDISYHRRHRYFVLDGGREVSSGVGG